MKEGDLVVCLISGWEEYGIEKGGSYIVDHISDHWIHFKHLPALGFRLRPYGDDDPYDVERSPSAPRFMKVEV